MNPSFNVCYLEIKWGSPLEAREPWELSAHVRGSELDSVELLQELKIPPGNRLEALTRERQGQLSIRINDQYRLCFGWTEDGPERVEIVDYH